MKLLFISLDLSDYNCKTHQAIFTDEIACKGHEITYISPNKHKPVHENVENINFNTHVDPSDELIKLLREQNFDVALTFSVKGINWLEKIYFNTGLKTKTVCQVLDVPLFRLKTQFLTDYHFNFQKEWDKYFSLLQKCDIVITNTLITKKILIGKGIGVKKIRNIYYGISIPNIPNIDIKDKKNQIVFVSRLRWYKGLDILMYSLAMLKDKPELHIIGFEEEEKPSFKLLNCDVPFRYLLMANQLNLKIAFYGSISDSEKFKIIKESKLAVFPDYSETISSLFPLEAVYCGTICLVGDFPINRERFKETVLYIDEQFNTEKWKKGIELCLENTARVKMDWWILKNRSHISYSRNLIKVLRDVLK
ncbi:MAG: glycosyltransferase family 4 protein [archaeon]|nr:glycosyltransferase family 4 protein [archaeon]